MLFSSHEAEQASELCINQKVNKKKMKINVWCESRMMLPDVYAQLRNTKLKQHLSPCAWHTLKAMTRTHALQFPLLLAWE